MKRHFWLAFFAAPVLVFGLVSDVAAGQVDGVNGEGGRPFTTTLSGLNEAPPVTSDLVGTAKITINRGQSELCWDLDYTTTQTVVAAHIHKAPKGVAGGVVFGFFFSPPVHNSGCRTANPAIGEPALFEDIAENPGAYYVNVHTITNPGGAGRGQLTK
jgi:hypothetical protein